jgi:hypothetical protein
MKNNHKKPQIIEVSVPVVCLYLAPQIALIMKGLLLNAFYDSVQYYIGPVIAYIFVFLLFIELIYVMVKYLGYRSEK